MSKKIRFTGIPEIPQKNVPAWQTSILGAMKEDVELLIGQRGEKDSNSKAVTQGAVTLPELNIQSMQQVSAKGKGFTISGQTVADLDDYGKLIVDVQSLANDLKSTRDTLNALIKQIKGS
tara:strand:+ start:2379 stop:2738 length:360 start_codon:yes stop_codon:yes gene_type:complete